MQELWKRIQLTTGVLAVYGAVLLLPSSAPWSIASQALDRLGIHSADRADDGGRRALELAFAGLALVLGVAVIQLVFARRRASRFAAVCDDLEDQAADLRAAHERLEGRFGDWIERRFSLAFRGDVDGRRIEFVEHAKPGDRGAPPAFTLTIDDIPKPAHRALLRTWIESARAGTPPLEPVELLVRDCPSGSRWLALLLRVERDRELAEQLVGVARDVTAKKEIELEAAVHVAIGTAWTSSISLETGLVQTLRVLCEGLHAHYGELWWIDGRFDVLRAGVRWHAAGPELDAFARRSEERTFGKGNGLAGRAWADADVVRLDDVSRARDPRCARLAEVGPFRSAVAVPIRIADRMVGVAVVLSGDSPLAPAADALMERLGNSLGHLVDHKRSERALLANEARKNAMIESALDCVITIDAAGRIVEFNPAAERTFGWTREEVLGRPMAELLIPEEYRPQQVTALQNCLADPKRWVGRRLESEALRSDGNRFPVEISITSIHVGDAPTFTAYLRDVTDRRELDRLKNEIVSTVSHELRTPLTSMRGFVELMLTREIPAAQQHRFLEIVDTEIRRLGRLIDDFLDLQRLESGALDYVRESLSLRVLIEETVQMFDQASEQHEFALDLPADPLTVEADGDRIRQVLINLLSNATKYSPDGGTVTVAARIEEDAVRVGIRDQGIGMDPDTLRKLFTRFFRADATETRRIGGTGLGLSLVKEIVEAHGGTVGVESEPGKGSEFHFTVPLGR